MSHPQSNTQSQVSGNGIPAAKAQQPAPKVHNTNNSPVPWSKRANKKYTYRSNAAVIKNYERVWAQPKGKNFLCHLMVSFLFGNTKTIVTIDPKTPLVCDFSYQPLVSKIDFLSDNHDVLTADIDQVCEVVCNKQFNNLALLNKDLINRLSMAGVGFSSEYSTRVLSFQSLLALQTFFTENLGGGDQDLKNFITKNRKDEGQNTSVEFVASNKKSNPGKHGNGSNNHKSFSKDKKGGSHVNGIIYENKKSMQSLADNSALQKLKQSLPE